MPKELDQTLLEAVIASNYDEVEKCLLAGADINAKDPYERTALHLAAERNFIKIAELLLEHHAPIDATMDDQGTPLLDAAAYGHDEMVTLLLNRGANIFAADHDGRNALHWAAEGGKLSTVSLLLERNKELIIRLDKHHNNALHVVGGTKATEIASLLIRAGVNIDSLNSSRNTPLHMAASKNNEKLVEFFLNQGANILAVDHNGYNTLHWAVESSNKATKIAKLLINAGINVNSITANGNTPLHLAARNGHKELVTYLVHKKAKINQLNYRHLTAAQEAIVYNQPEVAEWLNNKVIHRQLRAQHRFLDAKRSRQPQTEMMTQEFQRMRITPGTKDTKPPIALTGASARRHLMSDKEGFIRTMSTTGIYNGGLAEKGGIDRNWAREYLHYMLNNQELIICSQYKPAENHAAAVYMSGIGSYGDSSDGDILSVLNQATGLNSLMERDLANLLLDSLKTGIPITADRLNEFLPGKNFSATRDKQLLERFNRILVLTGIKEVVRRTESTVEQELPLAIAYIQGLHLVKHGRLQLRDLFAANATYGLPTDRNIQNPMVLSAAKAKLINLNNLFNSTFPDLPQNRESYHQLLLESLGGSDETDGEAYTTSDEESEQEEKSTPPNSSFSSTTSADSSSVPTTLPTISAITTSLSTSPSEQQARDAKSLTALTSLGVAYASNKQQPFLSSVSTQIDDLSVHVADSSKLPVMK